MKRKNLSITVNLSKVAMAAVRKEANRLNTYATGILRNAIREHFKEHGKNEKIVDPALIRISNNGKERFGKVLVASFSNPEVKETLDALYLKKKELKESKDFTEFEKNYYSFQAYMREEVLLPYLWGYDITKEDMAESKRKLEEA